MEKNNSFKESIIYWLVKIIGFIIRLLPLSVALTIGKVMGVMAYYFDVRHRRQVYGNLKLAFADKKSQREIIQTTKQVFISYGLNIIELLRIPLISPGKCPQYVEIEGKEYIDQSLSRGRGCILLAMHFGSWEMASLAMSMTGYPYNFFVKPQNKFSKLDQLLNSYRNCGGSVVLLKGTGTRDLITSLKNNEVVGMVVDQGGRDGMLVPFFGRKASMSIGAIRMGLKFDVPICFCVILRQKGGKHRLVIHKPFELEKTDNTDRDVESNLKNIIQVMEELIYKFPHEYMWFYKIWKYSNEGDIFILNDGRTGHLRQSQTVAKLLKQALAERNIHPSVQIIDIGFKSKKGQKIFFLVSLLPDMFNKMKLGVLKKVISKESLDPLMKTKSDYIISCGSSVAAINRIISDDHNAKSIVVLRPGLIKYNLFDLLVLPQHDVYQAYTKNANVAITHVAPNLITPEYLAEQTENLLLRYSHLKSNFRLKIGVLIGGNSKNVYLSEHQIRILLHQILNVAEELKASLLITTSRRTPPSIERLIRQRCKKNNKCQLLIVANESDVPEAVGGILGLSDFLVVSGDSISMFSEAACSGKRTIIFYPETHPKALNVYNKHRMIIDTLNEQGYVRAIKVKDVGQTLFDMAKQKIHTKTIDDNPTILNAVRKII